jgi:5-methylcytosine-specific restriction endonuclease McrA
MTLAKIKHKIQQLKIGIGSPVATDRIRGWELTKIRKRILLRDLYTCQVCGFISTNLEVDHIIPLHLGGPESDYNRQSL